MLSQSSVVPVREKYLIVHSSLKKLHAGRTGQEAGSAIAFSSGTTQLHRGSADILSALRVKKNYRPR